MKVIVVAVNKTLEIPVFHSEELALTAREFVYLAQKTSTSSSDPHFLPMKQTPCSPSVKEAIAATEKIHPAVYLFSSVVIKAPVAYVRVTVMVAQFLIFDSKEVNSAAPQSVTE